MKIAVVGAGLAGLAAAWLLSKRHRVTLLERQAQPGFIASSVSLPESGERVDVPLRVFYRGYYPALTRLYDALGVATEPVSYATTFTGLDGRAFFAGATCAWVRAPTPICCRTTCCRGAPGASLAGPSPSAAS